jgi:preprotein translocase subunit SecG
MTTFTITYMFAVVALIMGVVWNEQSRKYRRNKETQDNRNVRKVLR